MVKNTIIIFRSNLDVLYFNKLNMYHKIDLKIGRKHFNKKDIICYRGKNITYFFQYFKQSFIFILVLLL